MVPTLTTIEMLIDPSESDNCPPLCDKEEFFSVLLTLTGALSKVSKHDNLVGTCASKAFAFIKQIVYVDEVFSSKYLSERTTRASRGLTGHGG